MCFCNEYVICQNVSIFTALQWQQLHQILSLQADQEKSIILVRKSKMKFEKQRWRRVLLDLFQECLGGIISNIVARRQMSSLHLIWLNIYGKDWDIVDNQYMWKLSILGKRSTVIILMTFSESTKAALRRMGISMLYSHRVEARASLSHKDVVVASHFATIPQFWKSYLQTDCPVLCICFQRRLWLKISCGLYWK